MRREIGADREVLELGRRALDRQHLLDHELVRQEEPGLAVEPHADALDAGVDREHLADAGDGERVEQPLIAAERGGAGDEVDLDAGEVAIGLVEAAHGGAAAELGGGGGDGGGETRRRPRRRGRSGGP